MHGQRRAKTLHVPPIVEVARRIDRAVVVEPEQLVRMDLEVQVRRGRERIAGVADEADHVARLHVLRAHRQRRVAGEMRVVELVSLLVAHPQAPAAEPLPADAVQRPVRDSDDRGSEGREDVVAVVPVARHVTAVRAIRVDVARLARHWEHVVRSREAERRRHLQRLVPASLTSVMCTLVLRALRVPRLGRRPAETCSAAASLLRVLLERWPGRPLRNDRSHVRDGHEYGRAGRKAGVLFTQVHSRASGPLPICHREHDDTAPVADGQWTADPKRRASPPIVRPFTATVTSDTSPRASSFTRRAVTAPPNPDNPRTSALPNAQPPACRATDDAVTTDWSAG
jgi:hypothetical protein